MATINRNAACMVPIIPNAIAYPKTISLSRSGVDKSRPNVPEVRSPTKESNVSSVVSRKTTNAIIPGTKKSMN